MSNEALTSKTLADALAEWDRWQRPASGNDHGLPFNVVLTKRGEAIERLIDAVRQFLRAADEPPAMTATLSGAVRPDTDALIRQVSELQDRVQELKGASPPPNSLRETIYVSDWLLTNLCGRYRPDADARHKVVIEFSKDAVTKPAVELKPSEAASFDKTLARSPRRVESAAPDEYGYIAKGLAAAKAADEKPALLGIDFAAPGSDRSVIWCTRCGRELKRTDDGIKCECGAAYEAVWSADETEATRCAHEWDPPVKVETCRKCGLEKHTGVGFIRAVRRPESEEVSP